MRIGVVMRQSRLIFWLSLGSLLAIGGCNHEERHPMESGSTVAVAEAWSYLKPVLKRDSQKQLSNYEFSVERESGGVRVSFWPKVVPKGTETAKGNTDLAIDISVLLNRDLTFNHFEADV